MFFSSGLLRHKYCFFLLYVLNFPNTFTFIYIIFILMSRVVVEISIIHIFQMEELRFSEHVDLYPSFQLPFLSGDNCPHGRALFYHIGVTNSCIISLVLPRVLNCSDSRTHQFIAIYWGWCCYYIIETRLCLSTYLSTLHFKHFNFLLQSRWPFEFPYQK